MMEYCALKIETASGELMIVKADRVGKPQWNNFAWRWLRWLLRNDTKIIDLAALPDNSGPNRCRMYAPISMPGGWRCQILEPC